METFVEIQNLVAAMQADVVKFYVDKNFLAGRRVRKSLQNLKMLAQQMREEIQEIKREE
jgi:hypothetical protein